MKKILSFLFVLAVLTSAVLAQSPITLDDAIIKGAQDIQEKLAKGVKIVVLNFDSPTAKFSNYVLDEMIGRLASGGKLTVVDRQNLELIKKEMNFQLSKEVSPASMQEIGMKLGAQSIVAGSLEDMGTYFRIRFRTIEVVSATIQVTTSLNVKKDTQTNVLLQGAPTSGQTSTTTGGSSTEYPNGLNFSTGRKVGAGFLNLILGLGSFTMGDWAGGLIIAGAQVGSYLMLMSGPTVEGRDSYDEFGRVIGAEPSEPNPLFYVGLAVNLGSTVFGFVRPFSYDVALSKKKGTYYSSTNPMDNINIVLLPDNNGIRAVHLSYRFQY
jgi:TolB-like protein